MTNKRMIFAGLLLLVLTAGCAPRADKTGKPLVAVSILPQSWFVERIGGGRVDVLVLVGPGQSPHSYEPLPRQMTDLARAGAWILSGTDFETALTGKIAALYPELKIVDGTAGVTFRSTEEHHHDDGDHHGEEPPAAASEERDRHTWLGREPARILSGHVFETLVELDPAGRDLYEKNYREVLAEIDSEFDRLTELLAPRRGETVYVFHPAFGYFLDEFGLVQEAVETGGKEPTPRALERLVDNARADGVKVIFVQAQFPVGAAKTVADAVGAEVVPLDPLAPDWLENIRRMGEALVRGGSGGE